MGAGGSVLNDPYSETATLPNSKLFAPVVDLFLEVEAMKNKAAKCDALVVHDSMGQMYIPHTSLIDTLMVHSKAQLCRIRERYNEIDPTMNILDEIKHRLGGPYEEFMRHSVMSFLDIRLDLLSAAMTGLGSDEELMVEVFCLSNGGDLADLRSAISTRVHKNVTKEKIIGKTKKGSQLQKFFLRVLDETREAEGEPDVEAAQLQMTQLHQIATSKSRSADEYLDIIARCSRAQCQAIADVYKREHSFSLESSIQAVFRGCAGRAVTLWTMPLLDAVVYELKNVLDDTTFRDGDDTVLSVARLVSMRDKYELLQIEENYQKCHQENLISVFDNFAFGNIRAAIFRRFGNNFVDNGAEMHMNAYVRQNGGTMYTTFEQGHSIAQMTGFLTEMRQKYEAYVGKVEKTGDIAQAHISCKSIDPTPEGVDSDKKTFGLARESSMNTYTATDRQRYRENFKIIADFLRMQFKTHDYDRSGALDSVEFWTMMNTLDLGLGAKDIEDIKQRSDWDSDGHVTFEEASHELVDIIMKLIEKQGKDVKSEIERLIEERAAVAPTTAATASADEESMPPNLPKYLKASFEAYDTDKSGFLDKAEFWKFIRSIFTNAFTDYDIEMMQQTFDLNGDGEVTWSEAFASVYRLTKEMKCGNRDVWIGLVDKTSGKLFWYNLRDEQSFWMTPEDQERYQAEMSLDVSIRDSTTLAPRGATSPRKKNKSPTGKKKSA